MNTVASLLAQAFAFGLAVTQLPTQGVAAWSWAALYASACLAAVLAARFQRPRWSARTWLFAFFCALLLAAVFWGANFGLDALHGAGRRKTDVAASLGGLELWFVLCPGVASVAVSGFVRAVLAHKTRGRGV